MSHDHEHDDDHYYDNTVLQSNQHIYLKHYVEMLKTYEDALSYIANNDYLVAKSMLEDSINALDAIKEANFLAWNIFKTIDNNTYNLILSFDNLLNANIEEVQQHLKAEDMLSLNRALTVLIPKYLNWSEQVRKAINSHI